MANKEEWDEIKRYVKEADDKRLERYKGRDITKNLEELNEKTKNDKKKKLDFADVLNVLLKIVLGIFTAWLFYNLYKLMVSSFDFFIKAYK